MPRLAVALGSALALGLVLTGCTASEQAAPSAGPLSTSVPSDPPSASSPSADGAPSPDATTSAPRASAGPPPTGGSPALVRWFDRELSGERLRLGQVRERTDAYVSYDVTYRSESLRISGVLNVPRGKGPFPAVVLAHGYIDPAVYVRGQGMPRERRYLAAAGYVALHVDYRNHAQSDDDPAVNRTARHGYAVDVLNAVNALRATDDVPVDHERIAIMGRSMGGGVVYKALEMAPGLVDAGVVFAAVSSQEARNYRQFAGPGSDGWSRLTDRWGTPEDAPELWESLSPASHFDRIDVPVLMHHGTVDTTCPPAWATRTARQLERAGVDVTLRWYEGEGHTFGAAFDRAMARTVAFLDRTLD